MVAVIGYPRSGNTWLEYVVTQLGQSCEKGHWYNADVAKSKWIFPLRNYKECIVRHAQHGGIKQKRLNSYFNVQTQGKPCRSNGPTDYIDLLQCFDEHDGEKILVYYEELIQKPKETLASVITFLGLDGQHFLEDLENQRKRSLAAYAPGAATGGEKTISHSLGIAPEMLKSWDHTLTSSFPVLYQKYLSRYRMQEMSAAS